MSDFNPKIFEWARQSAGLGLDEAASSLGIVVGSLEAIECGAKTPSQALLSKMSKVYRRPLVAFYLAEPPRKGDRGEDFRTVVGRDVYEPEFHIDVLLRDLRSRQQLIKSVLEDDEDFKKLDFVASCRMRDGVSAVVKSIEKTLGITNMEYRKQKDIDASFNLLRSSAEQAGIFVLLAGNLGSYHSSISVETFRGFAIADPLAPMVVINDGDAKAAWSFTLLHELAHIWLGSSGVSAGSPEIEIEKFCNEVASLFLISKSDFENYDLSELNSDQRLQLISSLAITWRVSRQAIAYGFFKAGKLTLDSWKSLDSEIFQSWIGFKQQKENKKKDSGGPSFYIIRRFKLGRGVLNFAKHYYQSGILSPVKAAKVLGVKPRSVHPLLSTNL